MSIEQEKIDIDSRDDNENTLEQYGVWVKKSPAEPLSESEDVVTTDESANTGDELGGIDSVDFSFDDFNLDDSEIFSEDAVRDDENLDALISDTIESIEDEFAMPEFQENDDDTTLTSEELSKITGGRVGEINTNDDDSLDIGLDDFVEIENPVVDEVNAEEKPLMDESDSFDIDLDDFMEIEEPVADEIKDEKPLDMDLSLDDSFEQAAFDSPDTEEIDIDSFDVENIGNSDESVSFADEASAEEKITADDDFMDAASDIVFDEIDSVDEKPEPIPTEQTVSSMSTDLLNKIAIELAGLRHEMSQFKSALDEMKNTRIGAPSDTPIEKTEPAPAEAPAGGFFSDDEGDETIALSGDELNNILTNADFTAEYKSSIEESSIEESSIEESSIEEPIIEEPSIEEPIIEESSIEESSIEESSIEESSIEEPSIEESSIEESSIESLDDDIDIDYFQNSDTAALNIQENELEEPQLDDIDFSMSDDSDVSEQLPDEIDIPVLDDLVVDSSPVDFLEDETQKEIDDSTMQYLADEPDAESLDEIADEIDVNGLDEIDVNGLDDIDVNGLDEIDVNALDEVSDEIADDIEENVLDELPDEIADDIEENALDELPDEIADDIEVNALDEVSDEIADEIEVNALDELPDEIADDIEDDLVIDDELSEELLSSEIFSEPDRNSPISTMFHSEQWNSDEKQELVHDVEISQEFDSNDDKEISVNAEAGINDRKVSNAEGVAPKQADSEISKSMREEIKSVLVYMDQLLENLPEEKISEFAQSEHFPVYKKLFAELGIS